MRLTWKSAQWHSYFFSRNKEILPYYRLFWKIAFKYASKKVCKRPLRHCGLRESQFTWSHSSVRDPQGTYSIFHTIFVPLAYNSVKETSVKISLEGHTHPCMSHEKGNMRGGLVISGGVGSEGNRSWNIHKGFSSTFTTYGGCPTYIVVQLTRNKEI